MRGSLSLARDALAATGNSNFGWFGGGRDSTAPVATVYLINFSNDSSTASPRGSLTSPGRRGLAATSGVLNIRRQKAGNYGWFGGGSSGPFSTVDRIDFSNDSASVSVRGPLSSARNELSATGNSNYGWFSDGTTDRIDFSNDLTRASPRGPLSLSRTGLAATGNSNYGWFGGGISPTVPGRTARVDRINFSNDNATASVRGSLSAINYKLAATGNSNYGWFGGGTTPATVSTVDRINFSNDLAAVSIRGPLTLERYQLAATGNSNYGWFVGGRQAHSTVYRIDFSNDNTTAIQRGSLISGKANLSATGNSNYGWFGGGVLPGATARVDRIDFANDSPSVPVRGPLSSARYNLAAVSNTPT